MEGLGGLKGAAGFGASGESLDGWTREPFQPDSPFPAFPLRPPVSINPGKCPHPAWELAPWSKQEGQAAKHRKGPAKLPPGLPSRPGTAAARCVSAEPGADRLQPKPGAPHPAAPESWDRGESAGLRASPSEGRAGALCPGSRAPMQHPALLTRPRPLRSGERSRWRRAGLRPAPAPSRCGSVSPARGWVSRRPAPGLLSNTSGLSPGTVRHGGWTARSISPLSHSHQAHCERLAAFTAPSSNLLWQLGLWKGSPGRKHLSAALSLSAIPPFSSSSSFAACSDPSWGCSHLSPPAALCHTQSTGWTQIKANRGRRCRQSHHWSPRRTPCSPPSRYLASGPQLCFLQGCKTALMPFQLLPHLPAPAPSWGWRKTATASLLSLPR